MNILRKAICVALALASLSTAAADDSRIESGRRIFARNCQTCHGVTGPAASQAGPDLHNIMGRRAGSENSGIHSRASIESGIAWSREGLRRYLENPDRTMPGTIMSRPVLDADELEDLLDYLESLR